MQQGNLGTTTLRRRKRHSDPMQAYDALPEPLRYWLAQAALPWSPLSAQRVWKRARANGCSIEETLDKLAHVETMTLRKDKTAIIDQQKRPRQS